MSVISQDLNLDVTRRSNIKVLHLVQNDVASRQIRVQITKDGVVQTIGGTGIDAIINITRPDYKHDSFYGTIDSDDNKTVIVTIPVWAMEKAGRGTASISILEGSTTKLTTEKIVLDIDPSDNPDSSISQDDRTEVLLTLIGQVNEVMDRVDEYEEEASENALKSEGHALGTQDGVPVGSSSPYYHNNSKYWAEQAAESAASVDVHADGTYPLMTVGTAESAEQLLSDITVEDDAPYLVRTTGGAAEVADRSFPTLVGYDIGWNQLVQNGDFIDTNNWNTSNSTISAANGILTIEKGSGTSYGGIAYQRPSVSTTHKYLICCKAKGDGTHQAAVGFRDTNFRGGGNLSKATTSTSFVELSLIASPVNNTDIFTLGAAISSDAEGIQASFKDVMMLDLTLMFGSTIADALYAMEQAEAGSGLALLRSYGFLTKPYYSYNAGELIPVNPSAFKNVGRNQWDEEWEVGHYNTTTGEKQASSTRIRCKNRIPVLPNTVYYSQVPVAAVAMFYDAGGNFITGINGSNNWIDITRTTFTTPDNAYYMVFYIADTTYNHNICIYIYWDNSYDDDPYVAYDEHVYPIDQEPLHGLLKADIQNNIITRLYADGDIRPADGQGTKKYGIVDLGSLTWGTSAGAFVATVSDHKDGTSGTIANAIVAKYGEVKYLGGFGVQADKGAAFKVGTTTFGITDSAYSDTATFKAAMSGVYLVYELATPTAQSYTPFTSPQVVDNWGIEIAVDNRTVPIPIGHETKYPADLKAKIEAAPDSPANDGDYIMRREGNTNSYEPLASTDVIGNLQNTKADKDGQYPDMTVGQLYTKIGVTDKVPYNFRTSGGSADIGDREIDKIIGGTIAWNQIVDQTVAATKTFTDGDTYHGDLTPATNKNIQIIKDHVYLAVTDCERTIADNNGIGIFFANASSGVSVNYQNGNANGIKQTIRKALASYNTKYLCYNNYGWKRGFNTGDSITVNSSQCFDLTAALGSTIADYILTLETATTGAGVAWFKKNFPKLYYAYNAGQLMSVKTSAHKMTGFNQFGSELEYGNIGNNGQDDGSSTNYIRSKGYTEVVPNTTYCFYASTPQQFMQFYVLQYDKSKNFISRNAVLAGSTLYTTRVGTYALNKDTHYIRVFIYKSSEFTSLDNIDICINLHWDGERDGEYEPYVEYNYPLDSDLELRGIPKLDANNNLYYDGDAYESDGKVTRKYGIVDLGTLTFTKISDYFYATLSDGISAVGGGSSNAVCAKYTLYRGTSADFYTSDKVITYANSGLSGAAGRIFIRDTAYASETALNFKTAMSGVYLVYELATPTTEEADPYTNPQIVSDWGTEEYVDTRDVAIPVGHETFYQANLKAKLEMAPNSPSDGDGDYVVRQTNGENQYVKLVIPNELPTAPTTDGNYLLKVSVSGGTPTYSWVAQ